MKSKIRGRVTNVTVPLSGKAQNVTFNFTVSLRYSGADNINQTYFKIYVNDTANQFNRSDASTFNISNTLPAVPTIIFPTSALVTNLNRVNVSGSDPDGSDITYYLYVNGTFNQTGVGNFTFQATPEQTLSVNVSAYDGTGWSDNNTVQFVYDNLTPSVTNLSVTPTTGVINNPFTATAYVTDINNATVIVTIAGGNYTMNCQATTDLGVHRCVYDFSGTSAIGTYVVSAWSANDTAGNTGTNYTQFSYLATGISGASGGNEGGGGGGGGGLITITENGVNIIINGTFRSKPDEVSTYHFYLGNKGEKVTWDINLESNSLVKQCVTIGGFVCEIDATGRTSVKVSYTLQPTKVSETKVGSITLVSDNGGAVQVPIRVIFVNYGVAFPFSISLPDAVKALAMKPFFNETSDGKFQPRFLLLGSIIAVPSILQGLKLTKKKGKSRK